jgi:hypothetical protein
MSRFPIIVSHFLAADNSNPTALGWEPWRFYFTSVKYNTSACPAQAAGKYPFASTWVRRYQYRYSIYRIGIDTTPYAISDNGCRFTIGSGF